MNCQEIKYAGIGECKDFKHLNPVSGIEIIPLSSKKVQLTAIRSDETRSPVTNESISLVIDGKDFQFKRIQDGIYKADKELFCKSINNGSTGGK